LLNASCRPELLRTPPVVTERDHEPYYLKLLRKHEQNTRIDTFDTFDTFHQEIWMLLILRPSCSEVRPERAKWAEGHSLKKAVLWLSSHSSKNTLNENVTYHSRHHRSPPLLRDHAAA